MTTITKEMIIVIHDDLIRKGGQIEGIICEGTIDFVVDHINSEHGVYTKAAWALYMSRLHPFFDGQKRTSFTIAAIILRVNGYWLGKSDEEEIFRVLHEISDTTIDCDIKHIERWLKLKSKKWWKTRQRPLTDYF